jgi:hypothetical protein
MFNSFKFFSKTGPIPLITFKSLEVSVFSTIIFSITSSFLAAAFFFGAAFFAVVFLVVVLFVFMSETTPNFYLKTSMISSV